MSLEYFSSTKGAPGLQFGSDKLESFDFVSPFGERLGEGQATTDMLRESGATFAAERLDFMVSSLTLSIVVRMLFASLS